MSDDRPIEQPSDPTAPAPEPTSSPADATKSLAQTTPPTEALPQWTPPYPTAGAATPPRPAGPPDSVPPPPQAPPAAYPPAAYQTPTYQPAQHPAPGPQAYPPPPPSAYPQYGVPPVGYAAPQQTNVSGLVLTIMSGLLVFSCYFTLIGLPSFIIGIIAMTKQNTDWEGSRRLARIGWIVLGSLFALAILAVIAFIVIGVATDTSQY